MQRNSSDEQREKKWITMPQNYAGIASLVILAVAGVMLAAYRAFNEF